MAPQFVDMNQDGHIDIVTATFDGSPYVSFGGPDGFGVSQHILDQNGSRILLDQFWNYESKAWENAESDGSSKGDQCISALAYDWDADGDMDLILGEYKKGHLYRQMNEGSSEKPSFTGKSIAVPIGGEVNEIKDGMTGMQLVDWNEDGIPDLLVGGFGDTYNRGSGGGVWVSLNTGKNGAPTFGPFQTLIKRSSKTGTHGPNRPDAGLYATAVDYDGDHDLDLVVGGYSMWQPPKPDLNADQIARADALAEQVAKGTRALRDMTSNAMSDLESDEPTKEEMTAARAECRASDEYQRLDRETESARAELETLRPKAKREAAVWLYERIDQVVEGRPR